MREPTELSEWLSGFIGRGRRYPSARALALAADLDQSSVTAIIERGKAKPDTLARLAHALDVSAVEAFMHAGWIAPHEIHQGLSPDEADFVEEYRQLSHHHRGVLREVMHGLLGRIPQSA